MDSKLISIINSLYIYFLISVYFWVYLLRGFLVYGIIPAFCSLILTIDAISKGQGNEVGTLYKKNSKLFSVYKIQSFVISMFFILIYSLLFFMNMSEGVIASIATVSLMYFLILGLIYFTYYIQVLSFENLPVKQALARAYILSIKYFLRSFYIVILVYVLFILAKFNLILFLVLAPFVFGKTSTLLAKRALILNK